MLEPTGRRRSSTGKSAGSSRSSPQIRRRRSTDSGLDKSDTYRIARLEEAAESPDDDTRGSPVSLLCRLADRWRPRTSPHQKSSTTQRPSLANARRASTSESSYVALRSCLRRRLGRREKAGRRSVGGVRAFALSNSTSNSVPRATAHRCCGAGRHLVMSCSVKNASYRFKALTAHRRRPGQSRRRWLKKLLRLNQVYKARRDISRRAATASNSAGRELTRTTRRRRKGAVRYTAGSRISRRR